MNFKKTCDYQIGLKRKVLLFRKDDCAIDYKIDGGLYVCDEISSRFYHYEFEAAVTYSQKMQRNKAYSYQNSIEITIDNADLFPKLGEICENDWIVVLNVDGQMIIPCIDVPFIPIFDYTFSDGNSPRFRLKIENEANIPAMSVISIVSQALPLFDSCKYADEKVKSLLFSKFGNIRLLGADNGTFENISSFRSLNVIDFLKDSFSYTYSYDGNGYTSTVALTIPFDKSQDYFHYWLSEYQENRISMLLGLSDGKTLAVGFDRGLGSVFEEKGSTDGETDIAITFTEISSEGIWYCTEELEPETDEGYFYVPCIGTEWKWVDQNGDSVEQYICIGEDTAIPTAANIRKDINTPTNHYAVYDGYESIIANLETGGSIEHDYDVPTIVELYDEDTETGEKLKFLQSCSAVCTYIVEPTNMFTFSRMSEQRMTNIKNTCAWEITECPWWLSVNPMSGNGDSLYTLTLTTLMDASEGTLRGTVEITTGSRNKFFISVTCQNREGWIDNTFYITGMPKTNRINYVSPPQPSDIEVLSHTGLSNVTVNEGYISFDAPRNISGSTNEYSLILRRLDDNTTTTVIIYQSSGTEIWLPDGNTCSGDSLYVNERLYYYYSINEEEETPTTRLGRLIQEHSQYCMDVSTQWVDNEDTTKGTPIPVTVGYYKIADDYSCGCNDSIEPLTKYHFLRNVISYDRGTTWENNMEAVDIDPSYYGYPVKAVVDEWNSPYCMTEWDSIIWELGTDDEQNLLDNPDVYVTGGESTSRIDIFIDGIWKDLYFNGSIIPDENGDVYEDDEIRVTKTGGRYDESHIVLNVTTKANPTLAERVITCEIIDDEQYLDCVFNINQDAGEQNSLIFVSPQENTLSFNADNIEPFFEYSTDEGATWNQWDYSPINFGRGTDLFLRGTNPDGIVGWGGTGNFVFGNSNDVYCYGRLIDLLDYTHEISIPTAYCFKGLFKDCTALVTAPDLVSTVVPEYSYQELFSGCTKLYNPPSLPATDIRTGCYAQMFYGCTSLRNAPSLPAETLAQNCYAQMFYGCTSLRGVVVNAPTLVAGCYYEMLNGCSSLDYIECMAMDIDAPSATTNWAYGVAEENGVFKKYRCVEWSVGTSGIPDGWSVIEEPCPEEGGYVRFHPISDRGTITLRGVGNNLKDLDLEYSLNEGLTWNTFNVDNTYNFQNVDFLLRGRNDNGLSTDYDRYYKFELGATQVSGNLMYLIDYRSDDLFDIPCDYCFKGLFKDCALMVTAPELPIFFSHQRTHLKDYCYSEMFYGCTSLTTAPELSETLLADYCYESMFRGCASLATAPELPATTLTEGCYESMFRGCTILTTAPELPATTMVKYCYRSMFNGCTSLTTPPILPAMTLAQACYLGMFEGCTSLVNAPILPAMTLDYDCYSRMFSGCTSITTAPELPATHLAPHCYQGMFQGCISLVNAPDLDVTIITDYCYTYMFEGCTSLVNAPEMILYGVALHSCEAMFKNCTSLVNAPELPATTMYGYCYYEMFKNCTSLVNAPDLPATTLSYNCYESMFEGCIRLMTAPELPATYLYTECYRYMFRNCTNLNYIKCLVLGTYSESYTKDWTDGVSLTGTFVKNPNCETWTRGTSGIPSGWVIQDA